MPRTSNSSQLLLGFRLQIRVLILLCSAVSNFVSAQDTRTINEPRIPPICSVLVARPHVSSGDEQDVSAIDTERIQQAINQCRVGEAVRLAHGIRKADISAHVAQDIGSAFLSGPLALKSGVSLLIDADVTLFATSDARAYDRGAQRCGGNDTKGKGCKPLISIENADDSAIMGEGTIDGQGGHAIRGKAETWWQLARRAQREKSRQNVPRLIEVNRSRNFTLYKITLRNAPNFHVTLNEVDGFTAWGVRIDSPHDARNTDGIDVIASRNITIAHSFIRTGDDNMAIKSNRRGSTENISILHNYFYSGHGMSIGSETDGGVRNVLVDNLTMDGTTSGLRIKSDVSRGGLVSNIHYRNICMRNVRAPLDLDTRYDPLAVGNKIPVYTGISLERVRSVGAGKIILNGYDEKHPLNAKLDDVIIQGVPQTQVANANIVLGSGVVYPALSGDNVRVTDARTVAAVTTFEENVDFCSTRFVAFPASPAQPIRRPQLTPSQADIYSYAEVLKHAGTAGQETVDPWDPLSDALANGTNLKPDYVVDGVQAADNQSRFKTIQSAVSRAITDSATTGRKTRIYIRVQPGIYRELLYVPAASAPITIYSDDPDATHTKITADLSAGTSGDVYAATFGAQFAATDPAIRAMYESLKEKGRAVVSTAGSAIAWIKNNGFQVKNITFENAYNQDRSVAAREVPAAVASQLVVTYNQAVALMIEDADRVQFENVRFIGFQDTLYLSSSLSGKATSGKTVRSFFNRSYIEGDTDFIFGDATAYFYRSEIKTLGERKTSSYITAPSTSINSKYGFVFNECKFTHDATPNALAGKFYLGRQWFRGQKCTPYGDVPAMANYRCVLGEADTFSNEAVAGTISKTVLETVGKVIILNSAIGVHIDGARPWFDWNKKGARQYRPAQYSSDDFWDNLVKAKIDPARELGYRIKKAPAEPFLAEFNNRDE